MHSANEAPDRRLTGLDVARFFAFAGMVIVNFKVVMGADTGPGWLYAFTTALEGKAAASFVVLAGVGLGLAYALSNQRDTISVTLRRAAFLLVVGLLNALIFEADILHYYAFYFLLGVFLLGTANSALIVLIFALNIAFTLMALTLEYDTGWNWETLTYHGFWTPDGFVRNLFFNGWHPVIPWLGFLLYGIVVSRLSLDRRTTQNKLIVFGAVALLIVEMASRWLVDAVAPLDPELPYLVQTSPVPPFPLYTLAGISAASLLIGVCLRLQDWLSTNGITALLAPAGRQTLTLYIAHIFIGMGTLEALGMLGGQTAATSVAAALVFCALSVLYAFFWSRRFRRGPMEALMRRVT